MTCSTIFTWAVRTFIHICFTSSSSESRDTSACEHVHTICTSSVILTRIFTAVVDLCLTVWFGIIRFISTAVGVDDVITNFINSTRVLCAVIWKSLFIFYIVTLHFLAAIIFFIIPYVVLLVTSALGLKARVDACVLCCLHATTYPDSPLAWPLLTTCQPAWRQSCLNPHTSISWAWHKTETVHWSEELYLVTKMAFTQKLRKVNVFSRVYLSVWNGNGLCTGQWPQFPLCTRPTPLHMTSALPWTCSNLLNLDPLCTDPFPYSIRTSSNFATKHGLSEWDSWHRTEMPSYSHIDVIY